MSPNLVDSDAQALLSFAVPCALGGSGADRLACGLAFEELAFSRKSSGSAMLNVATRVAVALSIAASGNSNLIERYLSPRFGAVGGLALDTRNVPLLGKEPTAGSTLSSLSSLGESRELLVLLPDNTDHLLVLAFDFEDEQEALVVPLDEVRVAIDGRSDGPACLNFAKLQWGRKRSRGAHRLAVGAEALRNKNTARILFACIGVGLMRAILDEGVRLLSGQRQMSQPRTVYGDYSNIQAAVGRVHATIEGARSSLYHALFDASPDDGQEARLFEMTALATVRQLFGRFVAEGSALWGAGDRLRPLDVELGLVLRALGDCQMLNAEVGAALVRRRVREETAATEVRR